MRYFLMISKALLSSILIPTSLCSIGFAAPGLCRANVTGHNVQKEGVILLHGLARTSNAMAKMEKRLLAEGFYVINDGYPSLRADVETLSETAISKAVNHCRALRIKRIHFVTHSLGSILVRYYLSHHDLPELGRVVMLSPPNGGNEVVDHINGIGLLRKMIGPAGRQLGTASDSIPAQLGAVTFELGIITGDRSLNPLFSWLVPGVDDGVVSIRKAQVAGMKDFLVIHATHPFIMRNREAIEQTVHFLTHGQFRQMQP